MTVRRVLLLDASSLTVFRWHLGGVVAEQQYVASPHGYSAFQEFLRTHHDDLFYLLADLVDEAFQSEDLPYVQGRDRRELIRRKLSQVFYGSPLTLAISMGRRKEGRRDERFLFAALTGQSAIAPWLNTLKQTQAQLVGIFSLPQVIAALALRLDRDSPHLLVVTLGRAGLRQTFLDGSQLRFSRLAPMNIEKGEDLAKACAAETGKVYQYLAGQRLINRETPLKTLVLAHPDHFAALRGQCQDTAERRVELVDLTSLAAKLGIRHPPANSLADTLLSFLLVQRQPRLQFAPSEDRHYYRLWQARFGMRTTAAAILAGAAVFAGAQASKYRELTAANAATQMTLEANRQRYEAMLDGLPKIPISTEELRALTDRESILVRRSPGPEPLLRHISVAMGRMPAVEISRLRWHLANHPDEDAPAAVSRSAGTPKPSDTPAMAGSFAIVDLQAQLPISMAADHRSQLETVEAFAAALRGQNVQVKVISLPFETESGKSIRSDDGSSAAEPPRFVLRVIQRL